jgi:hypothetical protein
MCRGFYPFQTAMEKGIIPQAQDSIYQGTHKYYSSVGFPWSTLRCENRIIPKGSNLTKFAFILRCRHLGPRTVLPIECAAITHFFFCLLLPKQCIRQLPRTKTQGRAHHLNPSIMVLSLEKYPSRSSRLYIDRRQSYGVSTKLFVS